MNHVLDRSPPAAPARESVPDYLVELARYELGHWWYLGLRDLLERLCGRWREQMPPQPRVLDAGCGMGANLRLLADCLEPEYLAGFDISAYAVEMSRSRCPAANIFVADLCSPQLPAADFDLIVSCDVCSVPGLAACRDGLAMLAASLRRGGRLVLHLPAYEWLYSQHDRAVHHSQRFSLTEITSLLRDFELSIEFATHRMCLLFPAIVAARAPSILLRNRSRLPAQSDLRANPPWANEFLYRLLRYENAGTVRGWRWPFGSSLLVVGKKTA